MWLVIVRCALIAAALSVILVVVFAFIMQKQWMGMDSIPYVNLGIKAVCAIFSAMLAAGKAESRTPLWGALAGGAYMLLTYIVFSVLSGKLSFDAGLITDLAMCVFGGMTVGIIRNLKR